MVLPIVSYGNDVLREDCKDVSPGYKELRNLIWNMTGTLYASGGVGLAASQIGKSIRLFIIDTRQVFNSISYELRRNLFPSGTGIAEVFINAELISGSPEDTYEAEGSLSIPTVEEKVARSNDIIVKYVDADFRSHIKPFDGLTARAIQHEIDHTNGILFIDRLSRHRIKAINSTLKRIAEGKIEVNYRMTFPKSTSIL